MVSQVLELTPSSAGWYYAAPSTPVAWTRVPRPAPPPPAVVLLPDLSRTIGYGPDGRLRKATARPRLWLLV
jgi:hypothetical protein